MSFVFWLLENYNNDYWNTVQVYESVSKCIKSDIIGQNMGQSFNIRSKVS